MSSEALATPWRENYIEDAATARISVYRRDGSMFCDSSSNYDPPHNGIHLCGQTDDGEQPTTVARYSVRTPALARKMWAAAKAVAECGKGEHDFVVDLMQRRDLEDGFYSNRQLWPRAIAAWNEAAQ